MNFIISWCNNNSGFTSAVLSAVGVFISIIAIIVSIRTARLPYKKKLKLSVDDTIFKSMYKDRQYKPGIFASCVNMGSCDILLTRFGICAKHHRHSAKHHGFTGTQYSVRGDSAEKNIVAPTRLKVIFEQKETLQKYFVNAGKKDKIYLYARDSEGKEYYKKIMNYSEFYELYLKD